MWLEGFTQQEIADKVGCTRPAVKNRLDRINERLRKWWEAMGGTDS